MHYYEHHIGDYRRDTSHLSLLEHGVYRQMMDWYYLSESPLPTNYEILYRRLGARTPEEVDAIRYVVTEFFKVEGESLVHKKCEEVLSEYRDKAEKAKENGKRGGRPRKINDLQNPTLSSGFQNENQTETKTKPKQNLTINHKPLTNNHTPLPPKGDEEEEVVVIGRDWAAEFNAFWAEYPESRKKNRYRVESAWSSQRHHLPPKNELQEALRAFKASPEWKREGGKFIPAPETWIMERRWQDAPAYSPKAKPAPKSEVDEADAFAWRAEAYPESLEVHPSAQSFPFKIWPESIRAEYRNRNNQLQAA
jgi:uncharacterized protein YdaU (DUF1376 family)